MDYNENKVKLCVIVKKKAKFPKQTTSFWHFFYFIKKVVAIPLSSFEKSIIINIGAYKR